MTPPVFSLFPPMEVALSDSSMTYKLLMTIQVTFESYCKHLKYSRVFMSNWRPPAGFSMFPPIPAPGDKVGGLLYSERGPGVPGWIQGPYHAFSGECTWTDMQFVVIATRFRENAFDPYAVQPSLLILSLFQSIDGAPHLLLASSRASSWT